MSLALLDITAIIQDLASRPTHVSKLVQGMLNYMLDTVMVPSVPVVCGLEASWQVCHAMSGPVGSSLGSSFACKMSPSDRMG
jgi:hypothetical protein